MYFVYRSFFDCGRTFFNCEPLHSDIDEPKLGTMFAVYPDDRLSLGETKIAPAMINESGLYYSIDCNFSFPLPALVTNVANIRVVYRGPVRIQDEATLRHRLGSNRSMWLGPPCMNIEIIAVACAGRGGIFGSRSNCGLSRFGFAGSARTPSAFNSQASASAVSPND